MHILITGGTGFIGLSAARALRERGHQIRLLSSSRAGALDGFSIVQADVRDGASLPSAVEGIDAAVIAHQFRGFPIEKPATHDTFREVDTDGTRNVIDALKATGRPQRLVYLSGAAVQEKDAGRHPGIDAKLDAERHVRESSFPWVVLRASIVYGPGDHYFSRMAQMIEKGPVVPVFGDGRALAAPIHVDDLGQTIAACLDSTGFADGILDACGPNILSTNAVLDLLMQVVGQRRPVLHLPLPLITNVAGILERLPEPPITRGLIAFSVFDNTGHGTNADTALGLTFRSVDEGIRQVYGKSPAAEIPS